MKPASPGDLRPYFQTIDELPESLPSTSTISTSPIDELQSPRDGGPRTIRLRRLDWSQFFGNDRAVEIDVGSGRGLFLVSAGLAHPNINYLGIERDYKEGRRAAKRLLKRELANVRVLGGDVHVAFDKLIKPQSVSAVHVYFPDPWWKKKHKKRRVFTDQFAEMLARILRPDGLIHAWTDVEEYFQVISALMDHHGNFETLPPPLERQASHDMDYQTSFERKKRKAGLPIYRGCWRRY